MYVRLYSCIQSNLLSQDKMGSTVSLLKNIRNKKRNIPQESSLNYEYPEDEYPPSYPESLGYSFFEDRVPSPEIPVNIRRNSTNNIYTELGSATGT